MKPSIWLAAVLLPALCAAQDAPWHGAEAAQRALVRLWLPAGEAPVQRPVRLRLPAAAPADAAFYRAWDAASGAEVPVQRQGAEVLLDPVQPLAAGAERRFWLYPVAQPGDGQPPATLNGTTVRSDHYTAVVDPARGGVIASLKLHQGERGVETLGDGVHWWHGRDPQVTQAGLGEVVVGAFLPGPVCTALEFVYRDMFGPGNTLRTRYRFYRDFIEVDHEYHAAAEAEVLWFKLPVSLRATGNTPGLHSHALAQDQPILTEGAASRWTQSTWHDVSYLGDEPFALGVIAREAQGGIYFMDSVKPAEHEWIYAEPFGWEKPVAVKSDFAVRLTLVPHQAGPGRWRETLARREAEVGQAVSAWQAKGAPALDTDTDGLPDLAELERGTSPAAADTDGDGAPDGKDDDPMRGTPPPRRLALPEFAAEPTDQPQSIARVEPVGGVPTLTVDGVPYGPMIYTRCAGTWEQLAEMGRRNFPIHFEMVGSIGWPGEQQKVFERLDSQLHTFLQQIPNARVILRLYVCNPLQFATRHPDEVMCFNDGETRHFTRWYAMRDRPEDERGYPSFASEVWREAMARSLHEYVTHVRRSDYARNVIGYFVCGGGTEEWYYWGDYDRGKLCVDFSAPMLRAFRDHLRRRYHGDVAKLRAAWGDPGADFATALPPGPEARLRGDAGAFWDPERSQRVRDYYYVHNKAMEDSLLIFSRAVKQACNDEQLVGMFHGYLQNHGHPEGGQATLKELLASPDVDFWSGPPQYDRRGPGEHGCARMLMRTLQAHGKLWISESDIRTSFSEPADGNPSLYGRPPSLEESLACLQREYAHMLCEGGNGWWFQMGREWYHHEPILSLFDQQQRNGRAALAFDRRGDTDIAAVVDMESLLTGPWGPVTSSVIDAFKVQELCRLGAPVDHWELDDILAEGAPRYKLYLMLNTFSLTDAERRLIDQRLRRDGATIVWFFAPGLLNPDREPEMASANATELLGFGLESQVGGPWPMAMKLTEAGAAAFAGFDPAREFGSFERPAWTPDGQGGVKQTFPGPTRLPQRMVGGEGGEVLATWTEGGAPSIVQRRGADSTDVWIGSVMAPADLLRALARRAGCHLFCDADEIVYANHSFLALHTRADGERTFHLRRPSDVVDIFDGRVLTRDASEFKDTVPAYRTRVYFLGDAARWAEERAKADAFFAAFQQK